MSDEKIVYLCAAMDTKQAEAFYLKRELEVLGHRVAVIDMGIQKDSPPGVKITRDQVMGEYKDRILKAGTRSEASAYMIKGLQRLVQQLSGEGRIEGMISLGGSGGCEMASAAMRMLPLGMPKVILTTMASGNTLPYIQGEDILLINPVVDIQNLNFLTRHAIQQAAAVFHGMSTVRPLKKEEKKVIAISGFGVTTPCVDACSGLLQSMGYEVLIFHARGSSGGRIMEKMIRDGYFCGVLDITTSELTDEVCGGIYSVGADRLRGAIEMGIPYVVVPGALEMINLSTEDTLKEDQRKRVLYRHSPSSVKMRANADEMKKLGHLFAERLKPEKKICSVLIPQKGFSSVNQEGAVFYDPVADSWFTEVLQQEADPNLAVRCLDAHINEKEFAVRVVEELQKYISGREDETFKQTADIKNAL